MAEIQKRIAALLSVKSIVTLVLTATFCILTVKGNISDYFMNAYTMIITFYFVKQTEKGGGNE